jgi:glycosyltransferase involved in cell wall biosynthesis
MLREILNKTKIEYKKNGFNGVLRRAKFLFFSERHRLFYAYFNYWKKNIKKRGKILKDFNYKKNLISLIFVFDEKANFSFLKKVFFLKDNLDQSNLNFVVIIGNINKDLENEINKIKRNKNFKVFDLSNCDYSEKELIEKGEKESQGEYIFLFKNNKKRINISIIRDVLSNPEKNIKNDFFEFYYNDQDFRYSLPKKIAYIVPSVGISGGVAVILKHLEILKKNGHDVLIISFNKYEKEDNWINHKIPVIQLKKANSYLLKEIDILVATHWSTAFFMDLHEARRKIYFVQSDERRFDHDRETLNYVNLSYSIKSEYMTEAIWIQRWLKDEFNHDAYYVPNGLDKKVFHKTKPIISKNKRKLRILIEGGIDIWFKGMDDAYNAIKNLDCEIWIVSCQGKPKEGWRYDKFFEKVSMGDMKKIYSSCDVFLKMSRIEGFFGPPMEAMACGCAVVVGKVTGYDEYIKNDFNALVVDQGDIEGAKKAVKKLILNNKLREKLINNGLKTVKDWSWENSENFLLEVVDKKNIKKQYSKNFPERYDFTKIKNNF